MPCVGCLTALAKARIDLHWLVAAHIVDGQTLGVDKVGLPFPAISDATQEEAYEGVSVRNTELS
jgi:hypothetical protein